jgi:hypothetical protein
MIQPYLKEIVHFDGSTAHPASAFTKTGTYWTIPVAKVFQRIPHDTNGTSYKSTNPLVGYCEQVFYKGLPLTQIDDNLTPAAGQFSVWNYGQTGQFYAIGSDPAAGEMRITDLRNALIASQPVSMKGIGVRRYSQDVVETNNTGFHSAVYWAGSSAGCTVTDCIFEYNAVNGASVNKTNFTFTHTTFRLNGRCGIDGQNNDFLHMVECDASNNNRQKWDAGPGTAGYKFVRDDQVVIENCRGWNNDRAHGLWLDVSATRTTIIGGVYGCDDGQMLANKGAAAIQFEESDGGVYNNVQNYSYIVNVECSGARWGMRLMATGYFKVYNSYLHDNNVCHIYVWQDRGINPGSPGNKTAAIVPWLCNGLEFVNLQFGPGASSGQILAYDDARDSTGALIFNMSAADMIARVTGNAFYPNTTGSMIQWGKPGGARTTYQTPGTFQAAINPTWSNTQTSGALDHTTAFPLPADVAAVAGQPTGTKHIGLF